MITMMEKEAEQQFKKSSEAIEGITLRDHENAELKNAKLGNLFYAALVRSIYVRLTEKDVDGAIRLMYNNFRESVECRTCRKDIVFVGKEYLDMSSDDWVHAEASKDEHRPRPEGYGFQRIQAFNSKFLIDKIKELKSLVSSDNKEETLRFMEDLSDAIER